MPNGRWKCLAKRGCPRCPSLSYSDTSELTADLAQTGARPATIQRKPFQLFPATSHCWLVLPRDLVLPVSRPANQRPVAPRLLLLTLHFCRPPPPAPRAAAKRRVVSRRFRFAHVSVSHPLVARPLLPAAQYSTASAPKLGSLSGSSLLAFVFFSFTLYAEYRSIVAISIQSTL